MERLSFEYSERYFNKSSSDLFQRFKLIYLSVVSGKNILHKIFKDDFIKFIYVEKGSCSISCENNQDFEITSEDVIVINSNSKYFYKNISDDLLLTVVACENIGVKVSDVNSVLNGNCFMFHDNDKAFKGHFKLIFKEISSEKDYASVITNLKVVEMIVDFLRKFDLNVETKCGNMKLAMASAKEYLDNNYKKKITLEELANHCFISKYYFSRQFKKFLGIPAMVYLRKLRLDKAKRLLENTSFTVKVIAEQVGFEDELYFSKTFKSSEGLNPIEFRALSKVK